MSKGISILIISIFFLVLTINYTNFFITDDLFLQESSFFLLISCTVIILSIVYYKKTLVLNTLEKLCIGFIVLLLVKNSANFFSSITNLSYLVMLILAYLAFKKSSINLAKHWHYYTGIILLTLLLIILFSAHHCYIKRQSLDIFYLPNKTILGIVVASQLCFLLPFFKLQFTASRILRYASVAIFCGGIVLLIATNSRSAWLGIIAAFSFSAYSNIKNKKTKKDIKLFSGLVFVILLAGLFFYKFNSSNGRLLIYKISTTIFKDNWLFGIGTGKFKVVYNEYQAQYFASHSIDSKEALLADDTYYAFNDYYQLIIENGVIAIVFLIFFGLLLYKQIKNLLDNNNSFSIGATSSIICILVASLFSYPLQFLPLLVQLLFCFSIVNTVEQQKKINKNYKYLSPALIAISILCLINYVLYYKYQKHAKEATDLSQIGFKTKAVQKFSELDEYYFKDGDILFKYAQELYYINKPQEAKKIIEQAKQVYTSHELLKLSASINLELQNYVDAEKEYKTAIYMVPKRMLSRKTILDFYIERKDTINAIYWAKSILNMPVKVPSVITKNIQHNTAQILSELSK